MRENCELTTKRSLDYCRQLSISCSRFPSYVGIYGLIDRTVRCSFRQRSDDRRGTDFWFSSIHASLLISRLFFQDYVLSVQHVFEPRYTSVRFAKPSCISRISSAYWVSFLSSQNIAVDTIHPFSIFYFYRLIYKKILAILLAELGVFSD